MVIEYHSLWVHFCCFSPLSMQGFKLYEYGATLNLTFKILEVFREILISSCYIMCSHKISIREKNIFKPTKKKNPQGNKTPTNNRKKRRFKYYSDIEENKKEQPDASNCFPILQIWFIVWSNFKINLTHIWLPKSCLAALAESLPCIHSSGKCYFYSV